jgi:hypothetical protein
MSYATQGTIQVKLLSPTGGTDALKAFVTPVQDYHVKHGDKDYTILIGQNGDKVAEEARACTAEKEYDVQDYLKDALTRAASRGTTVEVEIEVVPGKPAKAGATPSPDTYKIVAVKMPATPKTLTGRTP